MLVRTPEGNYLDLDLIEAIIVHGGENNSRWFVNVVMNRQGNQNVYQLFDVFETREKACASLKDWMDLVAK